MSPEHTDTAADDTSIQIVYEGQFTSYVAARPSTQLNRIEYRPTESDDEHPIGWRATSRNVWNISYPWF